MLHQEHNHNSCMHLKDWSDVCRRSALPNPNYSNYWARSSCSTIGYMLKSWTPEDRSPCSCSQISYLFRHITWVLPLRHWHRLWGPQSNFYLWVVASLSQGSQLLNCLPHDTRTRRLIDTIFSLSQKMLTILAGLCGSPKHSRPPVVAERPTPLRRTNKHASMTACQSPNNRARALSRELKCDQTCDAIDRARLVSCLLLLRRHQHFGQHIYPIWTLFDTICPHIVQSPRTIAGIGVQYRN